MKRPFSTKDRVIVILDRILMGIACASFLWVNAVQRDFRWLMLGIICLLGIFFTSRYMLSHFKVTDDGVDSVTETQH
jgi:hypothetical protein